MTIEDKKGGHGKGVAFVRQGTEGASVIRTDVVVPVDENYDPTKDTIVFQPFAPKGPAVKIVRPEE